MGEYDDILPWSVSRIIQIKVRDQLNPLNTWGQTIETKVLTRPTSAEFSTGPTVRYPYFFPHSKFFNETDGYLHNDTIYIEISFLTPQYQLPRLLFFFLFHRDPNHFQYLVSGVSCRVSHNAKRAITLNRP